MLVAIAIVACRITNNSARLPLPSVLLASARVNNHQSVSVHSQGTRLIASRTRASPQSRVPLRFGAADGLSACINACACGPCSGPWSFTTTAATSWAAGGSGAAGKPRNVDRWSSSMDSRRLCNIEEPPNHSRNSARGRAAASRDAGAVQVLTGITKHRLHRRFKLSTLDRNTYNINDDLRACTSVKQLQQLVQQDGPAMTYVNLASAIVKLQRILSKDTRQQQPQVLQTADDLFSQLWRLQQPKLPQCKARELSNMIYSVCLLPKPLQQRYQWVVAQHLLPAFRHQVSTANPQGVSNVLYGLAVSGQHSSKQSTELLVGQLVAGASSQSIANKHCAVATTSQQIQPTQLQQLLDAFCAVAQKAKPQEIKDTLWAVATMQQQVEQVEQLDQMLSAFVMQLNEATPQEISNTMWACAKFRYLPKQLLTAPDLIDKLATATPQNLANTAWACGQLGYRDEQLMTALFNRVLGLVDTSTSHLDSRSVNAQVLANLCWSLAVLDMRQHALEVLTLVQAGKPLWASMVPEGLSQLYQVHMWLIDQGLAGGEGLAAVLTAQQLQQCQSIWHEHLETTAKVQSGATQQSVFVTLQHICLIKWLVPPALEQVSLGSDGQPDGAALIDITARTADGVWLAVEVDGPTHFIRPDGGLMGTTLYRNRALAARGYVVVSVPYYEWDAIRRSDRQQYMLDKVTAALQEAATNGAASSAPAA